MAGRGGWELLLTMQVIADDLEEDYDLTFSGRDRDGRRLAGVQVYYGQRPLDPSLVYVARAGVFDRHPVAETDICQVAVGRLRRRPEETGPLLEVEGDVPWEAVCNRIQRVFTRCQAWFQRLFYILDSGGGIYELCVAAMDFFHNSLCVHDGNFNILAMPQHVAGMKGLLVDEDSGCAAIPLESIQRFRMNPAYTATLSTRGARLWEPDGSVHRVLYVNIWNSAGHYCGRLLINELATSLKPGNFTMAEYFAGFLAMAADHNLFKSGTGSTFSQLLRRYLAGEGVDEAYLLNRLKMVGWSRHDGYLCCKTLLRESENDVLSVRRVGATIDMVLKKSFSFSLDGCVCTVCNLTRSGWEEAECREKLRGICRAAEMVMGVSTAFWDFTHLGTYFRQADKAMELGRRRNPAERFRPFSDHVLYYILCHFTEEFDVEAICSGAVLRLREMDRTRNTAYVETLRLYLDCGCQPTAAAAALYIHRSTLAYRLEKIREATGVDLEDADTRLYLQISLRLLAYP